MLSGKEIEEYGSSIEESGKMKEAQIAYNDVTQYNITGEDIGELTDYRYFSKEYIKDTLDIEGIDNDFIINIKTRTVILLYGVEKDQRIYYALCEIENEQYNVNYEEE